MEGPAERAVSRRAAVAATAMLLLTFGLTAVGALLGVLADHTTPVVVLALLGLVFLALPLYSALGRYIVVRGGNTIGLVFSTISLGISFALAGDNLLGYAARHPGGGNSWVKFVAWADGWSFVTIATPIALLFLLFPSGHLPTGRWRAVWWLWLSGALAAIAGLMIKPGPMSVNNFDGPNPFGVRALDGVSTVIGTYGGLASFAAALASIAALIVRMRRSSGDERQQIRLLVYVAAVGVVFFLLSALPSDVISSIAWTGFLLSVLVGLPGAVTIAVLRYRLYDIDVVISKTVLFGSLAAFITAVYVGIVVGIGALLGERGHANIGLSIVATAVVAVGFQPVRERMTRVANKLVYGERATPYQVLSEFAGRVGTTYASENVLPRTARVIAEGTGAQRADVWLRVGNEIRRSASWPPEEGTAKGLPLPADGESLPEIGGVDRAVPVLLQGSLIGAVTVTKAAGDPLRHAEEVLLDDLASQAGLVLANARLTAELQARLDELTERSAELLRSRQRIVTAQDEERRRLERNIHDGAQQHLVALAVKLRLARSLISRDAVKAGAMLTELRGEVDDALETLSNLALGIYPPLLEEQGLATALAAQYQRMDLEVRLHTNGTGRYPIDLEAAVYFCTLEALQNIAKYAQARVVDITIGEHDGDLTFEVTDNGKGFDPAAAPRGSGLNNMHDRLSVLGGDVTVTSSEGRGTTVRGRVPLDTAQIPAGAT